jgi:flagellar basal body-associated protein FliL
MMQQQPSDPVQDTNPTPKKKKKRGCCFGCSMILLLLIVGILGYAGYMFYKSMPHKSAVEKEYNTIPDYFDN